MAAPADDGHRQTERETAMVIFMSPRRFANANEADMALSDLGFELDEQGLYRSEDRLLAAEIMRTLRGGEYFITLREA
jgi:hypothetical protein